MKTFNYQLDAVTGLSAPSLYPGEKSDKWELPENIQQDVSKLNSIIEHKYSREFLKICAFYNKMFPSLRTSDWSRSFYNVPQFTALDQERADTGTGISSNYLKQIVDQVTSRLGTISFVPKLIADEPTLEYIVYKDETERILKKQLRNSSFVRIATEVFHDAAVLGYSHVFIDPYTGEYVKANDFEVGMYESQFNKGDIQQMLYRDYAFPAASVHKYLTHCSEEELSKITEILEGKTTVDFKMFIDATEHKVWVTINGTTLTGVDYPYDHVLITTFAWDIGFTRVTSTSLFDLLYPVQREINKINAKLQQLIRMYKGAVPVFNNDVDLAMKSISNGSGECLYVDSTRPIDSLMTVINPTPLDPQLTAEITNRKTEMYELAGIQQTSFDMENMRSAAAVIALDQTRDVTFQAQLQGMAAFAKDVLRMYIEYMSKKSDVVLDTPAVVDWSDIFSLIKTAQIDLQPVHLNDPLGNEDASDTAMTPDYAHLQAARIVLNIIKGKTTWETLPYFVDRDVIKVIVATYLVKFDALGIPVPTTLHEFLVCAFVDAIKTGEIDLAPMDNASPDIYSEVPMDNASPDAYSEVPVEQQQM